MNKLNLQKVKEGGAVIAAKNNIPGKEEEKGELDSLPNDVSESSAGKYVNKNVNRELKINPSMAKLNPRSKDGWIHIAY